MLVASSHTLCYTETNNVSIMSFKTTNSPSPFYRFLGNTDSLECYLFVTVLRQSHCPGYKNVRDHHLPPFPLCKHDFPAKLVKFPCWWDRESVFGPLWRVSQLSWTMVTSTHNVQGNITPGSSASSQIGSGRHFHESLFLILLTNGHHKA